MIHYSGVDVFAESASVERGVVEVANGEGYGVCDQWQEAAAPAHEELGDGHLCIEAIAKATAIASVARVPAASSAPEP